MEDTSVPSLIGAIKNERFDDDWVNKRKEKLDSINFLHLGRIFRKTTSVYCLKTRKKMQIYQTIASAVQNVASKCISEVWTQTKPVGRMSISNFQ